MESLSAYLAHDRRVALAQGTLLPDYSYGAALFADLSGFTPLTEALVRDFGLKRGAEELMYQLNAISEALITEVERYRGSVIGFAGDAITCWFDGDNGRRAISAALRMKAAIAQFRQINMPSGNSVAIDLKIAIAVGPVRRFVVGDPDIQYLDALAGTTIDRMASAEKYAAVGEIVVSAEVVEQLGADVQVHAWHGNAASASAYAVVANLVQHADPDPWQDEVLESLPEHVTRPWFLAPIYEQIRSGQTRFLAEIRPVVAMFIKFDGPDYDSDPGAGGQLDQFIRWVQHELTRYGGSLFELIIGDKGSYLYAVFGAPLSHDDDVLRAVAAALNIRAFPSDLRFQIGITQGRMWAGTYGSSTARTYSVLGDDVNLAARLMQAATPGQILISERIAAKIARGYRCTPLGALTVKGKQEAIPVWSVDAINSPSAQRSLPSFPTRLVGRERELTQVAQALTELHTAHGQIVRVEGVAGAGKSHFTATVSDQALALGVRVIVGACQSINQTTAYSPWQTIMNVLFDMPEAEGQSEIAPSRGARMERLEQVMHSLYPEGMLRMPLLGELLGLALADNATTAEFEPRLRQEALIALVLDLLQRWAQEQPLLLILEDIHWIDEASARLAVALARVLDSMPMMLLVVHRPALDVAQPILPELSDLPGYLHIPLYDLSNEGMAALIAGRLEGPASALLLALIQSRAQGNPFFAEELVDTLRESERIEQRDDHSWHPSAPLIESLHAARCLIRQGSEWALAADAQLNAVDLGIPDSVHGVVLSRLDRLPETHKLTLKVASVVGRIFELMVVAQSHPLKLSETALHEQVSTLEDRDFARLELPPPHSTYMFKHSITQEVAYATLLDSQQRELHLLVGETLERVNPDGVEPLAYHFQRSGERTRCLHYLERAARKAQREYANEIALSYYMQALALEERPAWRQGQIELLHTLGRREEELSALHALTALPDAAPFDVADLWGQYYEALGDYAQARTWIMRALESCDETEAVRCASCHAQLGLIARKQGEYEQAKIHYLQALDLIQDVDDSTKTQKHIEILTGLGTIYRQQSNFEATQSCYEQALQLSRATNHKKGEAEVLNNLGGTAYYQRNNQQAISYYEQALTLRRMLGDRKGEGGSLYNLATITAGNCDYMQARDYYLAALDIHQAVGNRWDEANCFNALAVMYQDLGDFARAQSYLEQALQITQEIGDAAGEGYILANLGLVAREQDDFNTAIEILAQGRMRAEQQEDKYLLSSVQSYLSVVYWRIHDDEQALHYARAALALRQEIKLDTLLADDLCTLALIHHRRGDSEEARSLVDQCLAVLDACQGDGPEFPQRDYLRCSQILHALDEPARAQTTLAAAYHLVMQRAERIIDAELRQSFLDQVPIHREIMQIYRDADHGPR